MLAYSSMNMTILLLHYDSGTESGASNILTSVGYSFHQYFIVRASGCFVIQVWVISVHFKYIVYINFICSIIHALLNYTHHTCVYVYIYIYYKFS